MKYEESAKHKIKAVLKDQTVVQVNTVLIVPLPDFYIT